MNEAERAWWKEAVVYQIYPQSFNDTDGDGVGDLQGIIERVDYLDALGVDVVWLNPVYDSPHADDGYDVRDYHAILDRYGTMADWERLLDELHDRGIRLIMDLVVNHTSDEHEWFVRSRDDEEYRDWYVWKDGDPDEPPNNWDAAFGGPAWTYDEDVGQWYLHIFLEEQPDLNWENEDVREAVYDMMNWWLEKGIDGFRMDVINMISKPQSFPDGDPDNDWVGIEQFTDGPRIDEHLQELCDRTLDDYDAMSVGECVEATPEKVSRYLDDGLDMVFHFEHVRLDWEGGDWWTIRDWGLPELKEVFDRWQDGVDWNAVYLGNHDQPRIVSRFGDDGAYRVESAKTLATFLLTMPGTPYLMQGDEIGMTNYPFGSLDEVVDPQTAGHIREGMEEGRVSSFEEVEHLVRARSRDNSRTPVQWTDGENAGFTTGDPWLPVNPNHETVNVEAARENERSVWHHYRDLIDLRHDRDVLVYGEFDLLLPDDEQVFAYRRTLDDETVVVAMNFSSEAARASLPDRAALDDAELLVGNYADPSSPRGTLDLRPWESRVYEL
jgi:glycosidase